MATLGLALAALLPVGAAVGVPAGTASTGTQTSASSAGAGTALRSGEKSVDLDGDGRRDAVGTTPAGVPYVRLATGRTIRYAAIRADLVGPARLDRAGDRPAVVFAGALVRGAVGTQTLVLTWRPSRDTWVAARYTEDGEKQDLGTDPRTPVLVAPDGTPLIVGRTGPEDSQGLQPIQSYTLVGQRSGIYTAGETLGTWCFTGATGVLVRCDVTGPLDSTVDVGPLRDLGDLFPERTPGQLPPNQTLVTAQGEKVRLAAPAGDNPDSGDMRLVVTLPDGSKLRGPALPAGYAADLWGSVLPIGTRGRAYVVQLEGGDSTTLKVFTRTGGSLVEVKAPRGASLSEGAGVSRLWWSGGTKVYVRTQTDDPHRYGLTEWRVSRPSAGAPVLASRDRGTFCLDEGVAPVAWGRC